MVLLFGKFRLQGKKGHADDGVHGRSDFMAHVGKKFAFCPVGLFGRMNGLLHAPLAFHQKRHVAAVFDNAQQSSIR